MTYMDQFRDSLIDRTRLTEGYQRRYRFPNDFGASVITHYNGVHRGKWEVCLLQFDGDDCRPITTLVDDPTTTQVFYFDEAERVTEQMQILADTDGPTGIEVIVATPVDKAETDG